MRLILLAAVTLGLAAANISTTPAAERVDFPSATPPPTPFALKQAKARGVEPRREPGTPLQGLLVRPDGPGPFPAVVLLHGCDGVQPFQERWADDLVSWGYVALLVDSHGPRGLGDDCARWPPAAGSRSEDALGALVYLRGLPFVEPGRVGVMGWDTGGRTVMRVVEQKGPQEDLGAGFAASVALYPGTFRLSVAAAPLLILIGGEDDCTPASRVRRAMQEAPPGPFPPRLEVLPGARHGFDDPRFAEPVRLAAAQAPFCFSPEESGGTTLAYSEAARGAAAGQVRAFLDEQLR
jgi:dienelactone hydrolase